MPSLSSHSSENPSRQTAWSKIPLGIWFVVPTGMIIFGLIAYFGPLILFFLQFGNNGDSGWSYFMADYSEETTSKTIEFSDQTVEFILRDYQGASGDVNVQVVINGSLEKTFPSYHDKDFWADFPAFEYGIRQDIDGDRQDDLVFEVRSGIYYISSRGGQLYTLKEPI